MWRSFAGLSPQRVSDWTRDNVQAPLDKKSHRHLPWGSHCSPGKKDGIMETHHPGYPAPSQCDHGDSIHGDRTGNPLKVPQEILSRYLGSSVFSAGVQSFVVDVNMRLKHAGFLLPFKSTFRHKTIACTLPSLCTQYKQKCKPETSTSNPYPLVYKFVVWAASQIGTIHQKLAWRTEVS